MPSATTACSELTKLLSWRSAVLSEFVPPPPPHSKELLLGYVSVFSDHILSNSSFETTLTFGVLKRMNL
jgi:hypothetical protein